VHVDLLTEGFDFPDLRWICLRKRRRSRNSFIQEIGRVLRISPDTGKTCALVLDPSGHLDDPDLGLAYAAEVGQAPPKKQPQPQPDDEIEGDLPAIDGPVDKPTIYAAKLTATRAYVRQLVMHFQLSGLLHVPPGMVEGDWRGRAATNPQRNKLHREARAAWHLLPDNVRTDLEVARGAPLTRGDVSDLIGVFTATRRAGAFPPGFTGSLPQGAQHLLRLA